METRKESLNSLKLCRFCLSHDETLTSLYDKSQAPKNSVPLTLKILSCISVEVFPSDKMPSYICKRCKFFMEVSYEFKYICRQADENILQYVQNCTSLHSISWPLSLKKIYRVGHNKAAEVGLMQTVVEGGATVQVMTHDMSDSDVGDDENVYNVKIGGSDEGSKSACIKVITSTDKQESAIMKPKRERKDSEETNSEDVDHGKSVKGEDCWPCTECNCTYPLQQLLELHKMQRHRARTEQCNECDATFFTKYDLTTHQLRHSNEMPFQCVACGKKFKRLILLKRHEKLIHSDLPQQVCPNCPATFLSHEELEAHQEKHARNSQRPFVCTLCDKRFHENNVLQRHIDTIHKKKSTFCCEYCPQQFSSVSKLTRHVRTHAGERAYPCKYCDKSFIKSHHYSRHLRLKHRETIRSPRGPFGAADQYRCEQCEDNFATQDDLIYHSAIHATQNLICPLCQEKFDDVDAVTAHIKSHVNGIEFMCDYCELVFTSKAKLDSHLIVAHDDEVHASDQVQDESSIEMDADDDDDNEINVKEEDDHMVVEIKKTGDFLLPTTQGEEERIDNTNSEDSEIETTYTELSNVDTLAIVKKETGELATDKSPMKIASGVTITKTSMTPNKTSDTNETQPASILRKAEEIKRKVVQQQASDTTTYKKEKSVVKAESNNTVGASDKSLRLLEKELQELKRTNTRSEVVKTPSKPVEMLRNRRPQVHTSTPKLRAIEKTHTTKPVAIDKKLLERRVITKENKEPKETKSYTIVKEEKEREVKEKETPKSVIKNGSSDKSSAEEGIRRSTRPSKIKDYAKMIRDRSQNSDNDESDDVDDDEEYKEADKTPETRPKVRRASIKPQVKVAQTPVATQITRKRGRPRKEQGGSKLKKEDNEEDESKANKSELDNDSKTKEPSTSEINTGNKIRTEESVNLDASKSAGNEQKLPTNVMVSPTGQTLKKVPIKSLPPGIKPLPLPINSRSIGGEVCEMQIGKKVVKVQKIVMTKAEVEAMAKKGLVEMKDGTMVLKQGIKLPTADPAAFRSTLVGDGETDKESSSKKEKAAPMRCDFGDDA